MLFNSWTFGAFFALVYGAYLATQRSIRAQNLLLLIASYVFYGWWDYRFLSLIVLSTLIDFGVGRRLGELPMMPPNASGRRLLLTVSVVANLGLLGTFKYFDFFADSLSDLMSSIGLSVDAPTLSLVLPVGISFYTFQTLSYTVDVYRGRLAPTRNLLDFAVFVAFFPQLVAGPIERASSLLPQIVTPRRVDAGSVQLGIYLVLVGFAKKVVVADRLGLLANQIFDNHTDYAGLDLILGVIAFSGQIYGDFSGYSDIARGLSRLMGFELMVNFRLPYFALTPSDFWRRWHVSLSTWLRDYLYIPLGGNRDGQLATYRNLFATMVLGGLWHGAAWTFVLWGAFHGAILILYRLFTFDSGGRGGRTLTGWRLASMWLVMTCLTQFGWLIFRAESLSQLGYFMSHASALPSDETSSLLWRLCFFGGPLALFEVYLHRRRDLVAPLRWPGPARVVAAGLTLCYIFLFAVRESIEFIYFQF